MSQQVEDIASKLEKTEAHLSLGGRLGYFGGVADEKRKDRNPLTKVTRDCSKTSQEVLNGMLGQHIKTALFNAPPAPPPPQ